MTTTLRVLALSGSLRRGSYNTAALRAAQELAPNGMTIDIVDIAAIPMFDQDVEQTGWPYTALDLAANVTRADALLIASTEYNHSFSAPIKNALDWLSRTPPGASAGQYVLARKPVAVLGASTGRSGSGRAQLHLRQVLGYLDMLPVNQPEVLIDHASVKFDGDGHLTDARTRVVIRTLLEGLDSWTRLVGGGEHPIQLARTGADVVHVRRAGSGPSYAVAGDNYIIKAGTADTGGTTRRSSSSSRPAAGHRHTPITASSKASTSSRASSLSTSVSNGSE
ncbi:MAG: NAD(P)H-dependent oxidoreductase [Mycobacteriaceae bacterium]|nr:NAD(P)H-dependent oxidoreductase [Mycobacteriaceae bacterium]